MRRGYRGYRGKRAGGCLIPLLFLLCVAAAAVSLFLHRNLVYTPEGTQVRIPFSDKTFSIGEKEPVNEDVNLVIEQPVEDTPPVEVPELPEYQTRIEESVLVPIDAVLDESRFDALLGKIKGTQINTVVLEVKAEDGRLAYASQNALAKSAKAAAADSTAVKNALTKLELNGLNACAQVSCFKDDKAPRAQRSSGIPLSTGKIWVDDAEVTWLDPFDAGSKDYVTAIVGELYDLGFKEILLTHMAFPTEGRLIPAIRYEGSDKPAAIDEVIAAVKAVAAEKGGEVAAVYEAKAGVESGQTIEAFADNFHRIYSAVEKSETARGVDDAVLNAMHQTLGDEFNTRFVPRLNLDGVEDTAVLGDLVYTSQSRGNGCMFIRADGAYPDAILKKE